MRMRIREPRGADSSYQCGGDGYLHKRHKKVMRKFQNMKKREWRTLQRNAETNFFDWKILFRLGINCIELNFLP